MNDEKKLPKAFRLTEETFNKFKGITEELGSDQQYALAKIMEVYELERGKEILPELRESIETFEGYVFAAVGMYRQALEKCRDMKALVRTEFESQLKSKDRIIEDLQERVDQAECIAETASNREREIQTASLEREKAYQNEIAALEETNKNLEREQKESRTECQQKVSEAEQRYKELEQRYLRLQKSEEETKNMFSVVMKENESLKEESKKILLDQKKKDGQLAELQREKDSLHTDLDRERKEAKEKLEQQQREFEFFKKNSDIECRLAVQVKENELKEAHKEEVDKLRVELDKCKELLYNKIRSDNEGAIKGHVE